MTTDEMAGALVQAGLKATPPRLLILQLFHESHEKHLTAEDVFRRLMTGEKNASVATIYRALMQFADAGLLERSHFDNGAAIFELGSGERHGHLVCKGCGKVTEFVDAAIEQQQRVVAAEHGFVLYRQSPLLYGLCGGCATSQAALAVQPADVLV